MLSDFRRKAIAPGCFNKHPPSFTVPGFGDAAPADGAAAGVFRRRKPKIVHQLARFIEPTDVTDGGRKRRCRDKVEPPKAPKRIDKFTERPVRRELLDPLDHVVAPLDCGPNRLDIVLEHNLLRRFVKALGSKPPAMDFCPGFAIGRIGPAMAQQE